MIDPDTFLLILYVMVDEIVRHLPVLRHPGPAAALTPSEVVTLALYGQWQRFPSERAFYRHAEAHLRGAFPRLPDRSQYSV